MKAVAPHDRPREKLERLGPAGLGDNELLALVLGSGSRRRNALDVANDLLDDVGGMPGLTRATVGDLRRVAGIGRARAAQVLAAVELGRRTLARGGGERPAHELIRAHRNQRLAEPRPQIARRVGAGRQHDRVRGDRAAERLHAPAAGG